MMKKKKKKKKKKDQKGGTRYGVSLILEPNKWNDNESCSRRID